MLRMIVFPTLLLTAIGSITADQFASTADKKISLAELAQAADVIVLAQTRDTDYMYRRKFPVDGSAFLKVLITYKTDKAADMIEVYEHGLHAHECYFQNPTVFEEGRRYLLFLQKDAVHPERYRGLAQGCALDVLVDRDNRYVLRLPVTGIQVSDPLSGMARGFEFADAYAVENDESLPPQQRDTLLASGWIVPRGDGYIYTQGVDLSTVRELMGKNGVTAAAPEK